MRKPKVSICIPVFNEEEDLDTCLKSILEQDYPRDKIEVLVIDDYSTDNTIKVAKRYGAKVLFNGSHDNETGRRIGYMSAKGELFMCMDADMRMATKDFISKMVYPFVADKRISGNFVCFKVNKNQPPLTRCISYDPFQRDPIYKMFTIGPEKIIKKKEKGYYLCVCDKDTIPPQGLMLYRKKLVRGYAKKYNELTDNEIPTYIINSGAKYFAFVPDTGVEHMLIRSLKELWNKRKRNIRVYKSTMNKRKFKWFTLKKDWPKAGIWMIYTLSFIAPIIVSIYKTLKYRDTSLLTEPMLNFISTFSIIFNLLKSGATFRILNN